MTDRRQLNGYRIGYGINRTLNACLDAVNHAERVIHRPPDLRRRCLRGFCRRENAGRCPDLTFQPPEKVKQSRPICLATNVRGKHGEQVGLIRSELPDRVVPDVSRRQCGSVNAAKDKGLLRSEGKEYVVQDGDMIYFRFNV